MFKKKLKITFQKFETNKFFRKNSKKMKVYSKFEENDNCFRKILLGVEKILYFAIFLTCFSENEIFKN